MQKCHIFVSKLSNQNVLFCVLIGNLQFLYNFLTIKMIIMKKSFLISGLFGAALLIVSCKENPEFDYVYYTPEEYKLISQSLNLPQLPESYTPELASHLTRFGLGVPPINSDRATLGRVLFYDKNLSSDQTVSCASCHRQEIGFADDRAVSLGVESRAGQRNSIALSSVANFAAYYGSDINGPGAIPFFWDNRAGTASDQNMASMLNPLEMNMEPHEIEAAVKGAEYYKPLFKKAFGDEDISAQRISLAIAEFVNAMGSYQSRFDAGANATINGQFGFPNYDVDFSNFSPSENRGKAIYMANCASCHSANFGRPAKVFSNNGLDAVTTDQGVGGITGVTSQRGTFKVPTLRNIALSAPYMHDGRFPTLSAVVDHYSNGIQNHPNLGHELRTGSQPVKMNFTAQQKEDLIAFLGTLTDDIFRQDQRFSDPHK